MYLYDNADYNLIDHISGHCWGPVMAIIGERDKQQRDAGKGNINDIIRLLFSPSSCQCFMMTVNITQAI